MKRHQYLGTISQGRTTGYRSNLRHSVIFLSKQRIILYFLKCRCAQHRDNTAMNNLLDPFTYIPGIDLRVHPRSHVDAGRSVVPHAMVYFCQPRMVHEGVDIIHPRLRALSRKVCYSCPDDYAQQKDQIRLSRFVNNSHGSELEIDEGLRGAAKRCVKQNEDWNVYRLM